MTVIENLTPRVQYNYIAEQQRYPITFPYIERQYVKCMVGEELLVYNVDYEIPAFNQESLDDNELYLTLLITPTVGDVITIYRETPLEQQSEFPQVSKFSSQKVTEALDKLTYQQQEQQDDLSSCIRLSKNVPVGFNTTLPEPEGNQVLQWNETGTQLINYDLRGEIADIDDKADLAISTANDAKTTAQNAVGIANRARNDANNALVVSNNAYQKANEANTKSTAAQTAATNAEEAATNAAASATNAAASATNAAASASTANTIANEAKDIANTATETVETYGAAIVINRQNIERVSNRVEEVNTVATNAGSVAATAINTANDATTTAGNAVSTSNRAISIAEGAADEVHTVVTTIDGSVQAATNAANNATNAADRATVAANRAEQAVSSKQDVLVSGTNIKTIDGQTILGAGDIDILPDQVGNEGKVLATNGSSVFWETGLPSQSGNNGKVLTTDGTNLSWYDLSSYILNQTADKSLSNIYETGSTRFQFPPCSINTGTMDEYGNNKTLTYSDSIITWSPGYVTTTEGERGNPGVTKIADVSTVQDGEYLIFTTRSIVATGTNYLKLIPKKEFVISKTNLFVTELNIMGSLNIDNNVLSGFSTNNYATLPNNFNTDQPFELVVSFTTGPGASLGQAIFGNAETYYVENNVGYGIFWGVNIYIDDTVNKLSVVIGNGVGTADANNQPFFDNSITPTAATKYKVKLIFDGTKYEYYLAVEDNPYSLISSKTTTDTMVYDTNHPSYLGCWYVGHVSAVYSYFDGHLDLNESYIKINNEYWWTGTEQGNIKKYWMDTSIIPATFKNYISPNYGQIGTPTHNTTYPSIISNLNSNNYIYSLGKLPTSYNTFEIILGTFKFSEFSNNEWMILNHIPVSEKGGFMIRTYVHPNFVKFRFWIGSEGSWDVASAIDGEIDHINDVDKYITLKLVFDGTQYILYSRVGIHNSWQVEKTVSAFLTEEDVSPVKIEGELPFIIGYGSNSTHYIYYASDMSFTDYGFKITADNIVIQKGFTELNGAWYNTYKDCVYIGDCTVSSGIVTSLTNRPFNACPYRRDLINSYHTEGSWYSVYSDGWCEQGGTFYGASGTAISRTFIFPFLDNDYYLNISDGINSNIWTSAEANDFISSATKTGFTFLSGYGRYCIFKWKACGYIQLGVTT